MESTEFTFLRQNNITGKESSILKAQKQSCRVGSSTRKKEVANEIKPGKPRKRFQHGLIGYSSVDECVRTVAGGLKIHIDQIKVVRVKRIMRKKEEIMCPVSPDDFTGHVIDGSENDCTLVVTVDSTGSVRLVALVVKSALTIDRNNLWSETLPLKLANNIQEMDRANRKQLTGSAYCKCHQDGGANYSVGCAWNRFRKGCKWSDSEIISKSKFLAAKPSALTMNVIDIGEQ